MDSNWGGKYRVDYDLIDQLEKKRRERERAYVCTMWDWLKDFRDHFTTQGWWVTTREEVKARLKEEGAQGMVTAEGRTFFTNCVSGEVGNPLLLRAVIER